MKKVKVYGVVEYLLGEFDEENQQDRITLNWLRNKATSEQRMNYQMNFLTTKENQGKIGNITDVLRFEEEE